MVSVAEVGIAVTVSVCFSQIREMQSTQFKVHSRAGAICSDQKAVLFRDASGAADPCTGIGKFKPRKRSQHSVRPVAAEDRKS